ncbi:MAG: Hsp20/alpha crystallin family protein [Spirochaetales bacterium]|nr:Hsp20/alpha crystallin family protein [Spirochaetales bacterium]
MALIQRRNRDVYSPWDEMRRLQEEINDLFNFDTLPSKRGLFDRSVSPSIDVVENDNSFVVTCELPGIKEKDIDVNLASNVLTIKGSKSEEKEEKEKNGKYYRKESQSGSFQRTLPLPSAVDPDKVKAEMSNGILTIELPKSEESKPKQIAVDVK